MDIRTDSVDDVLEHYGIKRRSGRYPWGSGDRPYQNSSKHSGDYALNRTYQQAVANDIRKNTTKSVLNSILAGSYNEETTKEELFLYFQVIKLLFFFILSISQI